MSELWSIWEMVGATNGATRGSMKQAIESLPRRGWELSLSVSIIGNDGHWPGVMAFWRIPGERALNDWLEAGPDDSLDERGLTSGKAKLCRRVLGNLDPEHRMFLIEYVVAQDGETLASLKGPHAVFAELLAPWQGIAVWGARDVYEMVKRERAGIGVSGQLGIEQSTGWFAIVPVEREKMV
jgi:hypothetical protein